MAMKVKGYASADQVLQTYRGDSKVQERAREWPGTAVQRTVLIEEAQRPVEQILHLAWQLCELDECDFREKVYSVWSKTATDPIHSWTFGDMFEHMDANPIWVPLPFDPKKWAAVQSWRPGMKANPPTQIGPLIAIQDSLGRILLDDGHTRLTAAYLEKAFPKTILLYVGIPPVAV
jgi:hypothetical protein